MNAHRDGDAIIAPRRAEGPDALGDAWVRLDPGSDEYQMWDEWLRSIEQDVQADPSIVEMLDFVQAAAGHDVTPGHDELHHYWTRGKGLSRWVASPEPWTTLLANLVEEVKDKPLEELKRWTSAWFMEVFGFSAGSDLNRVTHGHPPRGHRVGPG